MNYDVKLTSLRSSGRESALKHEKLSVCREKLASLASPPLISVTSLQPDTLALQYTVGVHVKPNGTCGGCGALFRYPIFGPCSEPFPFVFWSWRQDHVRSVMAKYVFATGLCSDPSKDFGLKTGVQWCLHRCFHKRFRPLLVINWQPKPKFISMILTLARQRLAIKFVHKPHVSLSMVAGISSFRPRSGSLRSPSLVPVLSVGRWQTER